ncbi:MFS transporter [Methanobacterium sp. ACI-7]|uniref:MFS transporter n=1 Tax=unclassified Methanobacterium TaxID=2627676 RepID=UPI0039C0A3FE
MEKINNMERVDTLSSRWTVLIIVSLSAFIITIDSTFMNVAITNLVVDLNTTVSVIQLIIATYALTMASLMLLGGKMQDIIGRKKTFLLGAIIYGFGTVIAALSVNSLMLLFGWSILEGIGAALMTPATASIITGSYSGKDRAFAIGIWTAIAGIAAAIGPILGGFLTTFFSWRYGFGLELIIVFAILALSRKIKHFPKTMDASQLDKLGILLSIVGFSIFVIGILSLNFSRNLLLSFSIISIGIIFLILFYISQSRRIKRNNEPLTDIRLFKDRNFTMGNISRLIMQLALAGSVFALPVFLQLVTGADAFTTGLVLLPLTVGLLICSIGTSRLAARFESRHIISSGFLVAIVGSLLLSYQFNLNTTLWQLVPGTFLLGVGIGLSLPLSADVVLSSASQNKQSDASGMMSTFSNLGSSIGTALIGVILIFGIFSGLATAVNQTYPGEFSKQEIQENIAGWVEKMQSTNIPELKENQASKVFNIVNLTIKNAMKTTFQFVSVIFFIGFITSLFIRPLEVSEIKK